MRVLIIILPAAAETVVVAAITLMKAVNETTPASSHNVLIHNQNHTPAYGSNNRHRKKSCK